MVFWNLERRRFQPPSKPNAKRTFLKWRFARVIENGGLKHAAPCYFNVIK